MPRQPQAAPQERKDVAPTARITVPAQPAREVDVKLDAINFRGDQIMLTGMDNGRKWIKPENPPAYVEQALGWFAAQYAESPHTEMIQPPPEPVEPDPTPTEPTNPGVR